MEAKIKTKAIVSLIMFLTIMTIGLFSWIMEGKSSKPNSKYVISISTDEERK